MEKKDLSRRPTLEKRSQKSLGHEVDDLIKLAKLQKSHPGIDGDFSSDRFCYYDEEYWKLDRLRRDEDNKKYRK